MRPGGEALGEGIEKQDGESERREFQRERIELPRGEEKDSDGDEREGPREGNGERSGGERALAGARIFAVVAQVDDAVDGHGGGAGRDHGDDDPRESGAAWASRAMRGARGQQRSRQRKRQREHGVLELDHFEDGADAAGLLRRTMQFVATQASAFFADGANGPAPAIHFFLRQADLREDAADVLRDEVVDGLAGDDKTTGMAGMITAPACCARNMFSR